jgi:hypothetical protein
MPRLGIRILRPRLDRSRQEAADRVGRDRTKARHWALAPVAFAAEADAEALVAVFTPDGKLRLRIRQRLLPKITPRPILIEPDQIRLITDETEAREHMFEAVLGAIYHGREKSPVEQRVAGIRAAYLALQRLEFRDYFRYAVLMSSMVPPELFSQAVEQLRAQGGSRRGSPTAPHGHRAAQLAVSHDS